MAKLTDTQLVILSHAARQPNGTALPLPATLTLNKGSAATVLRSLANRGLLAERLAGPDEEVWRQDDADRPLALAITDEGLAAVGIEPEQGDHSDQAGTAEGPPPSPEESCIRSDAGEPAAQPQTRPGTKQALLIDLLKRENGATVAEIGEATGWQAHSVRGAISGMLKKKLGLTVSSTKVEERGRVYRIEAA